MSYPQLIEKCAKAIAENHCTGCQALEDLSFRGNPNCEFNKIQKEEQIKINLRRQKMKYKFTIKEKAIGKERPRYSAKTHRMYTPKRTSTFEEKVKNAFFRKI